MPAKTVTPLALSVACANVDTNGMSVFPEISAFNSSHFACSDTETGVPATSKSGLFTGGVMPCAYSCPTQARGGATVGAGGVPAATLTGGSLLNGHIVQG